MGHLVTLRGNPSAGVDSGALILGVRTFKCRNYSSRRSDGNTNGWEAMLSRTRQCPDTQVAKGLFWGVITPAGGAWSISWGGQDTNLSKSAPERISVFNENNTLKLHHDRGSCKIKSVISGVKNQDKIHVSKRIMEGLSGLLSRAEPGTFCVGASKSYHLLTNQ